MYAMLMRNPAQVMFVLTSAALAYLVLPPFFFILHTSLVTDRGLQAGTFTIKHFLNIIDSLGDVRVLFTNSMIFSFGSAGIAISYGTLLAWLAERSNAPFRTVAYITAYVSFAIPGSSKSSVGSCCSAPRRAFLTHLSSRSPVRR
jgi:iron(III) transport system permease protein